MNLEQYSKFEQKMYQIELKRLINLGYTEKDAQDLALTGINTKMTNLLLLQLIKNEEKTK